MHTRTRGRARNGAKRGVRLEYKRLIAAKMDASRRDQRHRCLRQGSLQRHPGNLRRSSDLPAQLPLAGYFAYPARQSLSPGRIIGDTHRPFAQSIVPASNANLALCSWLCSSFLKWGKHAPHGIDDLIGDVGNRLAIKLLPALKQPGIACVVERSHPVEEQCNWHIAANKP